jgi:hypothetical protein
MAEPTDETLPGLGPQKRKLNKKVLVSAIVAGVIVAVTKLWPEYTDLFDGLRQLVGL